MAHGVKKFISSRHNDTIDSPTKFTWEGANDNKVTIPPSLHSQASLTSTSSSS